DDHRGDRSAALHHVDLTRRAHGSCFRPANAVAQLSQPADRRAPVTHHGPARGWRGNRGELGGRVSPMTEPLYDGEPPRVRLANQPTRGHWLRYGQTDRPRGEAERFRIWMKRDDQTGSELMGN